MAVAEASLRTVTDAMSFGLSSVSGLRAGPAVAWPEPPGVTLSPETGMPSMT